MRFSSHPYTLRQLQYIVAVAEDLSFRRAAERCHVSQPSLSAQLAQLEEGLGVQVFERSRTRVLLTVAGREIVERARRLLIDADDLMEAGRRASDPLTGSLRRRARIIDPDRRRGAPWSVMKIHKDTPRIWRIFSAGHGDASASKRVNYSCTAP